MEITDRYLTPGATHGRTGQTLTAVGVTVHYVGNPGSTAEGNRSWFENGAGGAHSSAHYIIGLNGEIIRIIPENERAQHAGKSYGAKWDEMAKTNNSRYIGIEVCHPDATGKFNDKTYASLIALIADICTRRGFDPAKAVVRHYDITGKECPRYYAQNPAAWAQLLADVKTVAAGGTYTPATTVQETPTLRKGDKGGTVKTLQLLLNATGVFSDMLVADGDFGAKTEAAIKAFQAANKLTADGICGAKTWAVLLTYKTPILAENANGTPQNTNNAPNNANDTPSQGTQAIDYINLTADEAAAFILELVRPYALKAGLFPSVKAAQMLLESDKLKSELAQKANNCFGMKTSLSGNTWPGSTWDGKSVYTKQTKEQDTAGNECTITADFRLYACIEDSNADHSAYLLGSKNGSALRYAGLTEAADYRAQLEIIKAGGYATDVNYVQKLCEVIVKYGLDKYDGEAGCGAAAAALSIAETVENLVADVSATDRAYWLAVLAGEKPLNAGLVKIVLDRYSTKLAEALAAARL